MKRLLVAGTVALTLLLPTAAQASGPTRVTALRETPALFDDEAGGDADADDPAIWVHRTDRARSLVLGTAKNGGLRVYDLRGRERQAIATPPAPRPGDESGRFNNVDLLGDLAVVTDRGRDQLRFYRIDPAAGRLHDVTAPGVPFAFSASQDEVNDQRTAYGLATFRGLDGAAYAVVSRRSTPVVGLFRLVFRAGLVSYAKVDELRLPDRFRLPDGTAWTPCTDPGDGPQVEGTVVDPVTRVAYLAQEDVGLWRVPLLGGRFGRPRVVEHTREYGIPAAFDPAEEECVVDYPRDPGFDRLTNRPRGHFAIADGPRTDGVQECDGAAVVATPLPGFPGGLLVVHDGGNTPGPADRPNTNFKFLDAGFLRP